MKKLIITFLTVFLSLTLSYVGYAASDTEDDEVIKGKFYLEAFGVDSSDADYSASVTRGYAASAIAAMLYDELSDNYEAEVFADMPAGSQYASAAYLLNLSGIMTGDGTYFFPDNPITYEQAAKIFVSALGRDFLAAEQGGYPNGYVAVAASLGMFDGIEHTSSDRVTFASFVKMFYNFTECKSLIVSGTGFKEYYEDEYTVFERKLKRCGIEYIEGVMTANQFGTADGDLNRIAVEGTVYYLGCDMPDNMLGYYVDAFIDIEDNEVIAVIADPKKNNVKTLLSADIVSIDFSEIKYYEDGKQKTLRLSDVSVARNDKALTTFTADDLMPLNGGLVLIDNDNDKQYEYVCVQNRQYCTVERTSADNSVVVIENGSYEGSTHIYINPDDEKFYHRIYKSNGEKADFSEIKAEDVLRIEGSPDQTVLRVYILDGKLQGKLTASRYDGEYIFTLGGQEYNIAKNAAREYILDIADFSFNVSYNFTVDGGFIVNVDKLKSDAAYAYVIRAYVDDDGEVGYRLVSEDKQLYKGFVADKLVYNGKKISKEKFTPRANVVIKYRVDSEGEICEIEDSKLYTEKSNKKYSEKTGILYSFTYEYPVFMSDDTVIFMIPDSGEADDYMADVSLVHGTTYSVETYDYDDNTSSPAVVLIYDDVYYESPGYIYADSPVCIFKEGVQILDENGEVVRQITWFEGEEEKTALVKDTANMNRIVSKMAAGDVFQYSLTTRGFVDNIKTLVMLDQNPSYFHTGAFSTMEQVYGKTVDIEFKTLPKGNAAKFVNVFTLDVGEAKKKTFLVTSEAETIYYYLYDSETDTVKPTTVGNVMAEDGVLGTFKASEVFIYYYNREATAVVIKK